MPNSTFPGKLASFEIEHKFLVEESFDPSPLYTVLRSLIPQREDSAEVRERYYAGGDAGYILRHSSDTKRQRLTLKQRRGSGASASTDNDIEVRRELSIALDPTVGDQDATIHEVLALLRVQKVGELTKRLHVFDYADCEVVYYRAQTHERTICCVEFEALAPESIEAARATLLRYEAATGFADRRRERRSLFELLFGDRSEIECSPSDGVST